MSRGGRSRGSGRADNPVSLFPFLSVLICTMGTLILLLVVISRNTRTQAAEKMGINTNEIIAELDVEAQTLEVFARDLQQTKARTITDIENEKARLATLESVIENMVAETKRAETAIRELENNRGSQNSEVAQLKEALAAKREALQLAEAELKQLQEHVAEKKGSYAIIPYRGINGTERRPMYIECRKDCVIIQPEGIVLREDDFLTASHPDNPLDAILRAASLHYTEQERVPRGTKPYPLIIVRPDGIDSYYAVRESVKSWGEQFGYELVESDWNLEFPPPDGALKQRLEMQLAASRERMIPYKNMLMQRYLAAQRHTGGNTGPSQGGLSQGGTSQYGSTQNGSQYGGTSNGGTLPDRTLNGNILPGQSLTGHPLAGNSLSGEIPGMPGYQTNAGMSPGLATSGGNSPLSTPLSASPSLLGGNAGAVNGYGNGVDGAGVGGSVAADDFANVNWGEVMATVGDSTSSGQAKKPKVEYRVGPNGSMIRYVDGQPVDGQGQRNFASSGSVTYTQATNNPQYAANAASQSHPTNPANSSGEAGQTPTMSSPSLGMTLGDSSDTNYAPMPPNWAMPNVGQGDTVIARPIRVECLPDRIWIRKTGETGIDREVEIPAGGSMASVNNTLASHFLDYISTWGNAARGTCWQPELNVSVHPGAENRFEELKSLMQNSGMRIRKK